MTATGSGLPDAMLPGGSEDPPARRKGGRGRRFLHSVSLTLITSGVLLLADAGLTVAWQEPLSYVYARTQQSGLSSDLKTLQAQQPTLVERQALSRLPDPSARIAFAARSLRRKAEDGEAVGRIRIPRIGLSHIVIAGTDTGDLRKGPGHYPSTPMPGAPGTVGIAGHRTTYGAPFRHVDRLRKGDRIVVDMPYAKVTYRVEGTRIVPPTATWVVDRRSYDRLVLTACHPLYSAAERIVVFARQVSETPAGRLA